MVNLSRHSASNNAITEEDIRKRVEELVTKRMVEEQAKLKEQTEAEVARRVQDARKHMETMMKEEHQKKTKEQEDEIARLKVESPLSVLSWQQHAVGLKWNVSLCNRSIWTRQRQSCCDL